MSSFISSSLRPVSALALGERGPLTHPSDPSMALAIHKYQMEEKMSVMSVARSLLPAFSPCPQTAAGYGSENSFPIN